MAVGLTAFPLQALPQTGAARASLEGVYARSTQLIVQERIHDHEQLVDSLSAVGRRSATIAQLHALIQARHHRHTGRLLVAHHLLDSVASSLDAAAPYLSYLKHYQHAKTLLDLEVFGKAKQEALQAIVAAERCGMSDEVLQMKLLACEIDLHADRLPEAQHGFERALKESRAVGHAEGICRALVGLGNVYYYQEQDSAALHYYNQAFNEARKGSDTGLLVSALLNIGASLSYTASPDSAIALYRTVLDTASYRSLGPRFRADLLSNMASMHSDMERHGQAAALIDSALAIYASLNDTASMAQTHLFKATALWHLGQREAGLAEAKLAHARTRSADLKAKAARKAADYLRDLGRMSESFAYLDEYATLADSLARSRYSKGIAGAQVQFETAEKERRIAEQEQALALSTAEGRRRTVQRNALIGATIALALIALLLYRVLRHRHRLARQQKELHDQHVDQLLSQQEIKSINAMLEGQEKERDRMAKDLHDRLGSMLGGIKANMSALEDRVEAMRQDQQYQKVSRLLDQTVSELRQISHDMAAATLSRFGLEKALKDLRDTLHISGRLQVELNTFGLEQRLERSVEIAVYRIIQELVSNVLKHAKASELSIGVTRAPGRLSVVVSDNGVGFDTAHAGSGMGLGNVRSRAAAIGATVQIDSTPGKGTTVSVECPVVE